MTSALGYGQTPYGLGPYGLGTPAATAPLGGAPLTGSDSIRQSARKIDLSTRRYVYDSTGRAQGDNPVHQQMQLVATTDLASSSVLALGNTIKSVKDVTPNVLQRIRAIYTNAYARMVSRGIVTIDDISVQIIAPTLTSGARALTTIKYTDLATGQPEEITL